MNTYRTTFHSICPMDGADIAYELVIRSPHIIKAEAIQAEIKNLPRDFHEDLADRLHDRLGGVQTIRARHSGVDIETHRPRHNWFCKLFGHRFRTVSGPPDLQGWGVWFGECDRCGKSTSDSCR